jgi:hypothetical protein
MAKPRLNERVLNRDKLRVIRLQAAVVCATSSLQAALAVNRLRLDSANLGAGCRRFESRPLR